MTDATNYLDPFEFEVPTVTLTRALLAADVVRSKDTDRPVLKAILFESKDVSHDYRIVATDAYRLSVIDVVIPGEEPEKKTLDFEQFGITGTKADYKALLDWLKAHKGYADENLRMTIRVEDKFVIFTDGADDTRRMPKMVGTYPDYRQLVTGEGLGEHPGMVAFNPRYLSDVGKCAKLFTGDDGLTHVRIETSDSKRPGRFRVIFQGTGRLDHWLMPVRVGEEVA